MAKNRQGDELPDFFVGYDHKEEPPLHIREMVAKAVRERERREAALKRQVHYVDVGHLPPKKALATVKEVCERHRAVPPMVILQRLIFMVSTDTILLRIDTSGYGPQLTFHLHHMEKGERSFKMQDIIFRMRQAHWLPIFLSHVRTAIQ